MLILTAHVATTTDERPVFLAAMARLVAATRAEPGCLAFTCGEDPWSPGAFTVFGRWRDRAALVDHERSAHVAAFKRDASPLVRSRHPPRIYDVAAVRTLDDVLNDPSSS